MDPIAFIGVLLKNGVTVNFPGPDVSVSYPNNQIRIDMTDSFRVFYDRDCRRVITTYESGATDTHEV